MCSIRMELDRKRWANLWHRCGVPRGREGEFDELDRRYAEAHRRYHNAAHIAGCLHWFDKVSDEVDDPVALELAIWFHDAVHDPRASDNEERSADLAHTTIVRSVGNPDLAQRVALLIHTTKTHEPGDRADARWLLDIDLAILGQSEAIFAAYDAGIRAEYAWVDDAAFAAGRRAVLEGFLARSCIYRTAWFRTRFEARARVNLARAVTRLVKSGGPGP